MKPRTREEIKVTNFSTNLPSLTTAQKKWAESHIIPPTAFINKRYAWCSECGQPLPRPILLVDSLQDNIVCPHCGKTLKKREHSMGSEIIESYYYMIVTTYNGYQVFRHFLFSRDSQKYRNAIYNVHEVMQNWINSDGKETIIARSTSGMCLYADKWQLSSEMTIKHTNLQSYYSLERYNIVPYRTYPIRKYIPKLKRNGFTGNFYNCAPNSLTKAILSNNEYEFLIKSNQISIFKYMLRKEAKTIPHKYAVNICNRNHYIVEDASLWYDMLDALEYIGKDTHSPIFVCPKNLKEAHDKAIAQKRRREGREKEEERRKEALEWEKKYKAMKEKYFDLTISNKNLMIKVLRSVAEFLEEGEEMHHCVFANGYYKREHCLILSAKDKNGKRIETIEVNLDSFYIEQSRGVCNSQTIFHNEIIKLVNDNMYKIKKLATQDRAIA